MGRGDETSGLGVVRFARYAYPPNALGYCGPDDARAVLQQGAARVGDGALRLLAAAFEGAWPYLELIAAANRIGDPLDARVVEAYWVGNRLLDGVPPQMLDAMLTERFRPRLGRRYALLAQAVPAGGRPHHSFHVLAVYPWVGLLRGGATNDPLRVLDRCRIRWGTVADVEPGKAVVRVRPLTWDGTALGLGPARPEVFVTADDGDGFVDDLRPGEVVSLHWDWVCERLPARSVAALRRQTARHLAMVNGMSRPAPANVLA